MRHLKISLHVLLIDGGEHVLIAQIPKYALGFSLEVWNHLNGFSNSVEEISITSVVYAHTSCAGTVWENLYQWVLATVFSYKSPIFNKVVNQLA